MRASLYWKLTEYARPLQSARGTLGARVLNAFRLNERKFEVDDCSGGCKLPVDRALQFRCDCAD